MPNRLKASLKNKWNIIPYWQWSVDSDLAWC